MSTVDNNLPTITVQTIDIEGFLVTVIIPENWSHDGKSHEKKIKVLEKCNFCVGLPVGTNVRLIDNCQYALVEEYMNELPSPPHSNLLITILQGTYVIAEDGGMPYKLPKNFKAKLPENCKFQLYSGTKLQGPTGLLTLKDTIKAELVLTKPEVEIKPPPAIVGQKQENKLLGPIQILEMTNDLVNFVKCCAKSNHSDEYVNSLIRLGILEYLRSVFGISIP